MDVLGDTELGIHDFKSRDTVGYIEIYGLLQALFLQQDAVRHIANIFSFEISKLPELAKVREIRNDAIGHPMNRSNHKSFHFISRSSVSKKGFDLRSHDGDTGENSYRRIDLEMVLEDQRANINKQLESIYLHMNDIESSHRKKYQEDKLNKLFPSNLSWLFGQIYASVSDIEEVQCAQANMPIILGIVQEFEGKLIKMGELSENSPTSYEILKVKSAIEKLEKTMGTSTGKDGEGLECEIYCEYIEKKLN